MAAGTQAGGTAASDTTKAPVKKHHKMKGVKKIKTEKKVEKKTTEPTPAPGK